MGDAMGCRTASCGEGGRSADVADDPEVFTVVDSSCVIERPGWTLDQSDQLQAAVDRIFGTGAASLLGLSFSFTIADPQLEGCPLIGCSSGFTHLCGYEMADIVGRNCRFLVDPVPDELVDKAMRRRCKDYCLAMKDGADYKVPSDEWEPWLPLDRPHNELFAVQKNARKNGTLFNNMFYMRNFGLGDFDDEKQYIVALQSELPGGKADLAELCKNMQQLDRNMAMVEQILAQEFIISGPMRRQDLDINYDALLSQDKKSDALTSTIPSIAAGA